MLSSTATVTIARTRTSTEPAGTSGIPPIPVTSFVKYRTHDADRWEKAGVQLGEHGERIEDQEKHSSRRRKSGPPLIVRPPGPGDQRCRCNHARYEPVVSDSGGLEPDRRHQCNGEPRFDSIVREGGPEAEWRNQQPQHSSGPGATHRSGLQGSHCPRCAPTPPEPTASTMLLYLPTWFRRSSSGPHQFVHYAANRRPKPDETRTSSDQVARGSRSTRRGILHVDHCLPAVENSCQLQVSIIVKRTTQSGRRC